MTLALDSAMDGPEFDVYADEPSTPDGRPAGWWARAGAFAIDVLAGASVVAAMLMIGWSAPEHGWLWWLCMVVAALSVFAIAVNRLLLPTATGWSLGRAIFGIAVVDRDGQPLGPWRLLIRDVAHLLDTAPLLLGWLCLVPLLRLEQHESSFRPCPGRTLPPRSVERTSVLSRSAACATCLLFSRSLSFVHHSTGNSPEA